MKNFINKFLILSLILFAGVVFYNSPNLNITNNNVVSYAESENANEDVYNFEFSGITYDSTLKEYNLNQDVVLDNADVFGYGLNDVFSGVLNGNGHTIQLTNKTLFKELKNAKIYNLNIVNSSLEIAFNNEGYSVGENDTFGLLAEKITSSHVSKIKINDTKITYTSISGDVSKLNIGILAGAVDNKSIISEIRLTNSHIKSNNIGLNNASGISTNSNVGMLIGITGNGAEINNNYIKDCGINLHYKENEGTYNNLGGMIGLIESGIFVTNNIVSFDKNDYIDHTTEIFYSDVKVSFGTNDKTIPTSLGMFIGRVQTNNALIINNIISSKNSDLFLVTNENSDVGVIAGSFAFDPVYDEFKSNLIVSEDAFVGNLSESTILSYDKIMRINNQELIITYIQNFDNWDIRYDWNKEKIWKIDTSMVLPVLQYFEKYNVSFSSEQSVRSLNIQSLPNDLNLVVSEISNKTLAGTEPEPQAEPQNPTNSLEDIDFGSSIIIKTYIKTENNYDKFFRIDTLMLNYQKFPYVGEKQETTTADATIIEYDNLIITYNNDGSVIFEIKNFISSYSGVYSVQLLRNEFELNFYVFESVVAEEGQEIIPNKDNCPGKIKSIYATESNSDIIASLCGENGVKYKIETIKMQYGKEYKYGTDIDNLDYSKDANWYLSYTDQFEYKDALVPNFENLRKIEWNFKEDCILFENNTAIPNNPDTEPSLPGTEPSEPGTEPSEPQNKPLLFNFDNYSETSKFEIFVIFSKDIQEVRINFNVDNKDFDEKLADVVIEYKNGNPVDVVYDEENNCYVAKIKPNVSYTLTLKNVNEDYKFNNWTLDDVPLSDLFDGDDYSCSLEINSETAYNSIQIKANFDSEEKGNNLMWLWIALCGVVLVCMTGTILIVIKQRKKGSGKSSKRNMYY